MFQKVKTYKGIEDLYLIRDDYLFNILAAVIDIQLQASVYKGKRTKKQIFCQLIEDVIKVAAFVNKPNQKLVLKHMLSILLYREEIEQEVESYYS